MLDRHAAPEAFAGMLARHVDGMYVVAHRILLDAPAAEEAVEAGALQAWHSLHTAGEGVAEATWLHRAAARMALRAADRAGEVASADAAVRPTGDREPQELLAVSLDALAGCSPTARACLVLRHVDGLSDEQLAEAVDSSVRAVRDQLWRARAAVAAAVSGSGMGGDQLSESGGTERVAVRRCPADVDPADVAVWVMDGQPHLRVDLRDHSSRCSTCASVVSMLTAARGAFDALDAHRPVPPPHVLGAAVARVRAEGTVLDAVGAIVSTARAVVAELTRPGPRMTGMASQRDAPGSPAAAGPTVEDGEPAVVTPASVPDQGEGRGDRPDPRAAGPDDVAAGSDVIARLPGPTVALVPRAPRGSGPVDDPAFEPDDEAGDADELAGPDDPDDRAGPDDRTP